MTTLTLTKGRPNTQGKGGGREHINTNRLLRFVLMVVVGVVVLLLMTIRRKRRRSCITAGG